MFIVYQLGTIRFEKRKMHSSIEISVDLVKLNWKGGTNKRGAVFVHIDTSKHIAMTTITKISFLLSLLRLGLSWNVTRSSPERICGVA